jgi:hypothetical protein
MTPERYEELRAYNREWHRTRARLLRQKRKAMASAWATLHDISCPYPAKGCRCRAIVLIGGTP